MLLSAYTLPVFRLFDLPLPEGGKSSWREHCPTPHCMSETLLQKYVFRCFTVACCRCLFLSFLPSFFLSLSLSLSLSSLFLCFCFCFCFCFFLFLLLSCPLVIHLLFFPPRSLRFFQTERLGLKISLRFVMFCLMCLTTLLLFHLMLLLT